MAKDTLSHLVHLLLKKNDISIDSDELEFQIRTHPTYPSLHAITGVLNHFNIENLAVEVPVDIETINSLPDTFLAQTKIDGQSQFTVVSKTNNKLDLHTDAKIKKTVTQDNFLTQFTGIVLAVEKSESSAETERSTNNNKNIISAFSLIGLVLLLLSFFNVSQSIVTLIHFGLSLTGLYISYVIIKQENGETTALGDAFCSNPTEKKSCNAVLSSKGAKLGAYLKISDASLIYFLGISLSLFTLILSGTGASLIMLISLIALPIVVYSIYYQAFVVKKWCALCLSIVAVLCIQAVLAFVNFNVIFNTQAVILIGLSFSTSIVFWLTQSQLIKEHLSLKDVKMKYVKFKRNFELFNTQLDKSEVVNTDINNINEITFGNPNSPLHIVAVTNPLCGHCKPVHKLLENILNQYKDTVKITIRFNVNTKDFNNPGTQIALRILELYNTDDSSICLDAMHDIYTDLSTEQWFKKWKKTSDTNTYGKILDTENQWCNKNNINFTPELLINGKSYPKAYDREDLIYFIEDLEEANH